MKLSDAKREDLIKQGYRFGAKHSAVKVCHWTKKSLRGEGVCYKEKFYGINCHRCVQMSPSLPTCTLRCTWCWRDIGHTEKEWKGECDDPKEVVEGCIKAHVKYLEGFGGNKKTISDNMNKYEESKHPLHFAISLSGEPTLYPKLPELITELKKNNISSFVVSNGTNPEMVKKLIDNPPTQFYMTLPAPDKETFQKVCNPLISDGWEKIQQTLELIKVMKKQTRTAIRLTLTKDKNFHNPKGYAQLIKLAQPLFVEA
jgi:tRNA wybutosine-synthesizing protein 1